MTDGVAILDTTLQANSVLYLEVSGVPQREVPVADAGMSHLSPGARVNRTLMGLKPRAAYTVICTAQASGRRMDYRLTAGPPLGPGRVEALGDWSARPNRLVVTARSDAAGALAISISAPKQPCDADDVVEFRDLRVFAH